MAVYPKYIISVGRQITKRLAEQVKKDPGICIVNGITSLQELPLKILLEPEISPDLRIGNIIKIGEGDYPYGWKRRIILLHDTKYHYRFI